MFPCALILILAIALDLMIGDPAYPAHPVRLIGWSIQGLEKGIRRQKLPDFWGGVLLTLTLIFLSVGLALILDALAFSLRPSLGFLFTLYVLYSCIALRDLSRHVRPILEAIDGGNIGQARNALQRIVGRDTRVLDETGVIRATIETIAEGLVDGFLSPIFYFSIFSLAGFTLDHPCLAGMAGALGYRVINTLDSMIGYKNEIYLYFGRFAAKLDDVVNYVPARLSVLLLFIGAWFLKMDAPAGLSSTLSYRHCASSPNAGYPESFVAGVLRTTLGGPVLYPFGEVKKPTIGDGTTPLTTHSIRHTLRLITLTGLLSGLIMALFLWISPMALSLFGF